MKMKLQERNNLDEWEENQEQYKKNN